MGDNWFWDHPVAYDGVVYAGNLDGKVYALNAQTGDKVAEFDLGSPVASSPVLVGQLVIIATEKGTIYSLNTRNNKITLLATIDAAISAPLAATDKVVYIHTADLTIHPVDIETGAKLTTIELKRPGWGGKFR